MATLRRTGMPVITETIAVAMATPAEGPSFGAAPSGTCTWMSRLSNKGGLMPKAVAGRREKAHDWYHRASELGSNEAGRILARTNDN